MSTDSDGVEEAMEGSIRTSVIAAGRVTEVLAREVERRARAEQAREQQDARELGARLQAERAAAQAVLAPVHTEAWWRDLEPATAAQAYQTATAWQDADPQAHRSRVHLDEQLAARYGLQDLPERVDLEGDIAAAMKAAATPQGRGGDLDQADVARPADAAGQERASAQQVVLGADRADRRREHERELTAEGGGGPAPAGPGYDSAQRRQQTAARLEEVVPDARAVRVRMTADAGNARPPREAVTKAKGAAATARPTRQVAERQVQVEIKGR